MGTLKHYVDGVEVSSIVEVFKELNVAETLDMPNDNYTGTAVYQWVMNRFGASQAVARVGVVNYYPKAELIDTVKTYLNRRSLKSIDINALAALMRQNPHLIEELRVLAGSSK